MDDRIVLQRVVETGSFSEAARQLGVSTSLVSRRVRALEQALGARLLDRTTRSVAPTAVGAEYVTRVGPLLDGLAEADAMARAESLMPSGRLRIALPVSFGLTYMRPVLTAYAIRYPEVLVDASFSDRAVDLLEEGFDVAIRGGRLPDSTLSARRIRATRGVVVASPAYLRERGTPSHPSELGAHQSVEYTAYRSVDPWTLTRGSEVVTVRPRPVFLADNGDALRDAAIDGLGVAAQPDFIVADALARGALVEILPEWRSWTGGIYVITPSHRLPPAKVRLFVDLLVETLGTPNRPAELLGTRGTAPPNEKPPRRQDAKGIGQAAREDDSLDPVLK